MNLFTLHYPKRSKPELSAYFYWYKFMGLVPGYGTGHPLWTKFGDVSQPFWPWWVEFGEDLFMSGIEMGVWEIDESEEIDQARRDGAFIVRIDPACTRQYLLSTFKDFLDEKGISTKVGRRLHKDEVKYTRFAFAQRPDVGRLKTALAVWTQRNPPSGRKPPSLYTIGAALGLSPESVVNSGDTESEATSKRNVMNATVSRYNRWARNLIDNVALGDFPVFDPPGLRTSSSTKGSTA